MIGEKITMTKPVDGGSSVNLGADVIPGCISSLRNTGEKASWVTSAGSLDVDNCVIPSRRLLNYRA
jgi:hypothetical protein